MSAHGLDMVVDVTAVACKRWKVDLNVPEDADIDRAGTIIRSALMRAAKNAAAFAEGPFYPDDHSWTVGGIRGVTLARMIEEAKLAKDKMGVSVEEWGIMARVSEGNLSFDVPVAVDLDQDSSENILALMRGREAEFVDIEALSSLFEDRPFGVRLHAGNWTSLREEADALDLTIDRSIHFRRPVTWDLMRAELSGLPIEPLPPFNAEEFYSRYAKSARYDANLMESNRALVESLAKMTVSPKGLKWQEWHPAVIDLLNSIGRPAEMDGISILLNFVVEEPAAVQPPKYLDTDHPDHTPYETWHAVGFHNMVVCYGMHPLTAGFMLKLVREDPLPFYDLPPEKKRRFRLLGASAIQDASLFEHRASLNGRTQAYDQLVDVQTDVGEEPAFDVSAGFDMTSVTF